RDPRRLPAAWRAEHAAAVHRRLACRLRRRDPPTVAKPEPAILTAMGDLVVGMDAGGTKTRAFAMTRAGEIVGRGAGGGANLLSSPDPQGSIGAALREALAGKVPAAIVLASAGGEREADRAKGRAILR